MPQVLRFVRCVDPGLDVGEVGRVGQQAGEHVHQQRQAVALVAADGQQEAIERGGRVGGGAAALVGGPGVGDGLAALEGVADLGTRHHTHRHVEQEGVATRVRHTETQRAVAQACIAATPGRDGRGGVATDDAGETRLGRDQRIGRDRPEVVAAARQRHPHTVLACGLHGSVERVQAHQRADAVVAIDLDQGRRHAFGRQVRLLLDAPTDKPLAVGLDTAQAVGGQAEQVGHDQDLRHPGGVGRTQAQALEGPAAEVEQFGFGEGAGGIGTGRHGACLGYRRRKAGERNDGCRRAFAGKVQLSE